MNRLVKPDNYQWRAERQEISLGLGCSTLTLLCADDCEDVKVKLSTNWVRKENIKHLNLLDNQE